MEASNGEKKIALPLSLAKKDLTKIVFPRYFPLEYSEVLKAKIVINRPDCVLHNQFFYQRYKSHHDLVEYVRALHDVCYCKCGVDWPFFMVFPYKDGEGLIIK
jgi:hypothetical protein